MLENIALGVDDAGRHAGARAADRARSRTPTACRSIPRREVHTLSVGERQRIEIVRCLLQNPKLLIMDEPTSVLTPQEVERLFETLRQLAAEGVLDPLHQPQAAKRSRRSATRATILRGGKVVGDLRSRGRRPRSSMAELMIGAEVRTLVAAQRRGAAARRGCAVRNLEPAGDGAVRHRRSRTSRFEVRARRDLRHRRRRRQRPERAVPGALGRAAGGRAPRWSAIDGARSAGWAPRARRELGLLLRAGGAQRPRRGARHVAGRERRAHGRQRMGSVRGGFINAGAATRFADDDHREFDVGRRRRRPRRARCRAATCRSSSSAARSCRTRACWWSRSRPGASMPAPPPRSTRR